MLMLLYQWAVTLDRIILGLCIHGPHQRPDGRKAQKQMKTDLDNKRMNRTNHVSVPATIAAATITKAVEPAASAITAAPAPAGGFATGKPRRNPESGGNHHQYDYQMSVKNRLFH